MIAETRCPWLDLSKPLYVRYHDEEWGVPVRDDRAMFEHLALECAQAGLSWYTVLAKRENYRRVFEGFDPARIARFGAPDVERLLTDPGIIRNRAKIEAVIGNARAYLELQAREGSFADFLWGFVDGSPVVSERRHLRDYPVTTPASDAMARELKRRGFRFVGSTSCYAHMQATGMVNDHVMDCFRRGEIMAQTHGSRAVSGAAGSRAQGARTARSSSPARVRKPAG